MDLLAKHQAGSKKKGTSVTWELQLANLVEQLRASTQAGDTVVLDRCCEPAANDLSTCPLPEWPLVRQRVENVDPRAKTNHWAKVSVSCEMQASFYRRLRDVALVNPTSFTSSAGQTLTLGVFLQNEQTNANLPPDQLHHALIPQGAAAHACPLAQAALVSSYLQKQFEWWYYRAMKRIARHAAEAGEAKPREKSAPPSMPLNPVKGLVYLNNVAPEHLQPAVRRRLSAKVRKEMRDSASFFSRSATYNALVQDDYKHHPESLWHLLDSERGLSGVFESGAFFKVGGLSVFPLHDEQLGMHFTHHQLTGESFWFMLRTGQEKKIAKLAWQLAVNRQLGELGNGYFAPLETRADELDSFHHAVAATLYHAKALMPPPTYLRSAGIAFDVVHLQEGQVITGRGPHFGIGVGQQTTVSFATNQLHEQWLLAGGIDHIETFFCWLEQLTSNGLDELAACMQHLGITDDHMARALNQHPPVFTCMLLEKLEAACSDMDSPHRPTFDRVPNLKRRCGQLHAQLHSPAMVLLYEKYYYAKDDPSWQLCSHM